MRRFLGILLVVLLLVGLAGWLAWTNAQPPADPVRTAEADWKLLLVNETNPLPEDWRVEELVDLYNGEQVDSRIYPALQAMFDDARAQGVWPLVNEGYRSHARQQELLNRRIAEYRDAGCDETEARRLALQQVALPGTSEHELGLAVDIIADGTKCGNETVYRWLRENAPEYGFILRYPADKTELTGIEYEPWHYRYVGQAAAKEMTEQGICLEEYLDAD